MSHYPFRALGDSADLDYTTLAFDHRLSRYIFLAGLAVLIYDHLLTLDAEIKLIWSTKLRPGTCWFLVARYIALSANIGVTVYSFKTLIEVTLSLRVFAMYGLNIWVLVCLLSAICVIGTLGLWASITFGQQPEIPAVPGLVGCHAMYTNANSLRAAGTWGAILVCDLLVFALTFGDDLLAGFLSWFTTSLSVTLLSRLMLNLHEAASGAARINTNTVATLETIRFTEMGNTSIGDTLDIEMIRFTEMGSTAIDDESRSGTQASLAM
ncbi:hypothetical protein B0H14DRAFT_3787515 [Mycena olivaceomarginata]|nr:hypothetical protein B0H14DRAFT_3787515 [Mycena olivaceomarginata]